MLLRFLALLSICISLTVGEDVDDSSETVDSVLKGVVKVIVPIGKTFFYEQFVDKESKNRWTHSSGYKTVDGQNIYYTGKFEVDVPDGALQNDYALILTEEAHHYAISAALDQIFNFSTHAPLIIQYEVRFSSVVCAGAYVKLISYNDDLKLTKFFEKTPYTIMFGPDKCNSEKCHFIIRYKNPKTGNYTEHEAINVSKIPGSVFTDKQTHLFKLVLERNHNFKIYVDDNVLISGNLFRDMEPPIIPPKEILDETSVKPKDWDDREKIPDPNAQKPDDWDEDEPPKIPDPDAVKPDDWLEDEPLYVPDDSVEPPKDYNETIDGKWEAPLLPNKKCESVSGCGKWSPPMIENPKYKGRWVAPMINNPNYKGVWKQAMKPNPDYFEEKDLYSHLDPIAAIGLELWSMDKDIVFDNFLITSDQAVARQFADQLWRPKAQGKLLSGRTIESILEAAGKRPWLYALYVILIFVPLVIFLSLFKKKSKPAEPAITHKKTDDIVPDDDKVTDIDEEPDETPMAKSDLGVTAEEEEEAGSDDASESPTKRKSRARKDT